MSCCLDDPIIQRPLATRLARTSVLLVLSINREIRLREAPSAPSARRDAMKRERIMLGNNHKQVKGSKTASPRPFVRFGRASEQESREIGR